MARCLLRLTEELLVSVAQRFQTLLDDDARKTLLPRANKLEVVERALGDV